MADLASDPQARLESLLEEQRLLRREIDRLSEEQQRLRNESAKGSEKKDDKKDGQGDDQKGDGKDEKEGKEEDAEDGKDDKDKDGKDKDGKDGKDGEDDKDKDDKDGKDKKPKEPVGQRVGKVIREHPVAIVLSLVGIVVLTIAGIFLLRYLNSYESTDDAQVDGHVDPIASRITGTVVGVYVENSRTVVKGQLLVDLDPRDYEVSLHQAQANYAQAIAALNAQNPNVPITVTTQQSAVRTADLDITSANAQLLSAQQSYESSEADLVQAEANELNASAEEERYRALVQKQEVSRESYDQQLTNKRALEAVVVSRRSSANAAQRTVDERKAAVDQAITRANEQRANLPRQIEAQKATVGSRIANVQAAKAQLDQATLNLTYCRITSPVDGIIGDKTVEVGTQVQPGFELFAITPTDDIWVTANFKETQIRQMHPGQSVTIHVDTLSQDFNGYLQNMPGATGSKYSLIPPENATGNYVKVVQRLPVRLRFKPQQPNADRLRPGMSVEPKVWVD